MLFGLFEPKSQKTLHREVFRIGDEFIHHCNPRERAGLVNLGLNLGAQCKACRRIFQWSEIRPPEELEAVGRGS